jgi:hypothetical protein
MVVPVMATMLAMDVTTLGAVMPLVMASGGAGEGAGDHAGAVAALLTRLLVSTGKWRRRCPPFH